MGDKVEGVQVANTAGGSEVEDREAEGVKTGGRMRARGLRPRDWVQA